MATSQQQQRKRQQLAKAQQQAASQAATQAQRVAQQLALRVAGVLASNLAAQLAKQLIAEILGAAALELLALAIAFSLLERSPAPVLEGVGEAQRQTIRINSLRRAAYLVAATKRIEAELAVARAKGRSLEQAAQAAKVTEERYFAQHYAASSQRMSAASKIDALRERYGDTLGWRAKLDSHTTPECAAANGKNFSALRPPAIGWPGFAHVRCRCYPTKPFRNGEILP